MAAGELTRATRTWAGWIPALLAMSAAMLIALVSLGPVASAKAVSGATQLGARQRLQPVALLDRRTVGAPGWWKGGSCDPANYPGSHPLGATWHGLIACGPGPTQGGSDHTVSFFPGSWGEFEWECVELSMRWMYEAWGVNPYPADGWNVVRDYDLGNNKAVFNPYGPQLLVVNNPTVGAVPQPGDVISIARSAANPYGHTAVVTANAVDAHGNGTITIIQQNGGVGNDGWATYPVKDWIVGDGVSGWLHNPAWSFQRPVIGYSGVGGFAARIAAPGNAYESLATYPGAIAVAGDAGPTGTNGKAIYGYIDETGDFFVRRASSAGWMLVAHRAQSMAVALGASGTPVLAYLSTAGDFYAEEGPLSGAFTLEATGVASIALAGGTGPCPPLLGYLQAGSGAFFTKLGVRGGTFSIVQASGVRAIALSEGSSVANALVGYESSAGTFFVKQVSQAQWTKEATNVTAIALAEVGPTGTSLLGYLAGGTFYAAEGVVPSSWADEASGVSQIALSSSAANGALPVLGYVTTTGNLEVMQGPLSASFSIQARGVESLALSSVTDS
jgi:surface antigen